MERKEEMGRRKLKVGDLFAGIGGLSEGFLKATPPVFELVLSTDIDKIAYETHKKNQPNVSFICGDILEEETKESVIREIERSGEIDVMLAGPPCQGFSMAGKRLIDDPRNRLFKEFIEVVNIVKPNVVLMENVPQFLSLWNGKFKKEVDEIFESMEYRVEAEVLQASDFGVPQIRRRAFFLGAKKEFFPKGKITFPALTHIPIKNALQLMRGQPNNNYRQLTLDDKKLKPFVSVEDAIGDLPPLKSGEGNFESDYTMEPFSQYQEQRREKSRKLYNHKAWNHRKELLEYIKQIPEGGRMIDDVPKEKWKGRAFSQAYARLHRKGIAYTITTYIHNPGSGRFIHYRDLRAITIREAARLQSFDDDFIFTGPMQAQERHVGNAVPPILGKVLAEHIYRLFFKELA